MQEAMHAHGKPKQPAKHKRQSTRSGGTFNLPQIQYVTGFQGAHEVPEEKQYTYTQTHKNPLVKNVFPVPPNIELFLLLVFYCKELHLMYSDKFRDTDGFVLSLLQPAMVHSYLHLLRFCTSVQF